MNCPPGRPYNRPVLANLFSRMSAVAAPAVPADAALFGKDPTARIVDVLPLLNGNGPARVRVYRRSEDLQSIAAEEAPFYPFFFLSDAALLKGFARERVQVRELSGENFYRHLVVLRSWGAYWDAVRHVERAAGRRERRADELYLINNPAQQYLMQTGRTANVQGEGAIEAIDGDLWQVYGIKMRITPETEIIGEPEVGRIVRVRGTVRDGQYFARTVTILEP